MEIKTKADVETRKWLMTAESFKHPAKMSIPMLLWIVQKYTKPGDVILDPMAGAGTTMLACWLGRKCILVELEQKFVDMCNANWEKLRRMPPALGFEMGRCEIRQGDARQLAGVLADVAIFSPPYSDVIRQGNPGGPGASGKGKQASCLACYSEDPSNIGNLPHGDIDVVIASPPYEASVSDGKEGLLAGGDEKRHGRWKKGTTLKRSYTQDEPCKVDAIISSPPYEGSLEATSRHTKGGIPSRDKKLGQTGTYADLDIVIASPPYEGTITQGGDTEAYKAKYGYQGENTGYTEAKENIGNTKGDTYLRAMRIVYQQCYRCLKPHGLMILVVKPFIRNQQVIHLERDTQKLCESVGFTFLDEHYRRLTHMSFWRTLYARKYPKVERVEKEFILVFRKEASV